MNIDLDLKNKILNENIRVHALEARYYEQLHTEIFNGYEQRMLYHKLNLINRLTENKQKRRAIDLGCGTGNLLFKLHRQGFEVTGVDISQSMIDIILEKGGSEFQLICSDVDSFINSCESETFDVVTCSSVLHHLPDYLSSFSEIARLLTYRGVLFITHEPARLETRNDMKLLVKIQRFVSILSFLIYDIRLFFKGIRLPHIDYSFSDFHVKQGINIQALIELLISHGYRIVEIEYYVTEQTAWGAYLNNRVFHRTPNQFTLIAQKIMPALTPTIA